MGRPGWSEKDGVKSRKKTVDNRISSATTHTERGIEYAKNVISGKINACKWVKLACQRQIDDLKRQKNADFKYRFDEGKAEKICQFFEYQPHIKGKWAGSLIKLEPWQEFVFSTVFGWVNKDTALRRFREMYLEIPRKNAKSICDAVIGLYMLAEDGEAGAEVYCGATTEKQAWEVFRPARLMAKKSEGFKEFYGIDVNASNLSIQDTAAKFEPIVGDPGDGASPHCAIIDEFHEHKTSVQYDAMITGMGAREQPLIIITTTAGTNLGSPCYDKRIQITKILQQLKGFENEEIFGVIYGIDDNDDWTDFENWKKANPNYGVSVFEDYLRARHKEAIQRPSRQNIIRCKHLNQWMNADVAYFDMLAWNRSADPTLKREQFHGKKCVLALDLASKHDPAALVQLIPYENEHGEEEYALFANYYLHEEAAEGEDKTHYAGWAKEGWLTLTPGNIIDYEYIIEDLEELKKNFQIVSIPYDPCQATMLATQMLAKGFPMVDYAASVPNFSEPMKHLEALIRAGKVHHDGNPITTWMFSNVVAHTDKRERVFPNKETQANKIDGAVASIMCTARWMMKGEEAGSVYEKRGALVFGLNKAG